MSRSLTERAFGASLWRLLQSIGIQGSNFITQVVLARLLMPADFGLIALIWVLILVLEAFVVSGYGSALIQKEKVTRTDECSVFYFNLAASVMGYALLWMLAPWLAQFYDQPLLTSLTRVVSLTLVIGALGHIQLSLLAKQIDCKTQCRIDLTASVTSGIVGIVMAFLGFGVWSLVAQQLSRVSTRVMLAWCYCKWRPAWLFSFRSLRSLFAFGSNLLLAELLETLYRNAYAVVIGKLFSPTELGLYSRASRLQELPMHNVTSVVAGVAFPVFSRVQEDRDRLKSGLSACLRVLALCTFPVMVGLAAVAEPFVSVLLTKKWLPCVPYLQMLCIAGGLYPFYYLHAKILLATGRSRLFLWLHLFQKVVAVLTIVMTYRWGVPGLVSGQIAAGLISSLLAGYIAGKLVKYPLMSQLADVCPYLTLSVVIGIAVYGLRFLFDQSGVWLLLAQVAMGAMLYISSCYVLRLPAFVLLHGLGRKRFWLPDREVLVKA